MSTTASESWPLLDSALQDLRQRGGTSAPNAIELAEMLARSRNLFQQASDEWVGLACGAKGMEADSEQAAEEWLAGPFCVLRLMRLLESSLRRLAERRPLRGVSRNRSNQRPVAEILPADHYDRLFYRGFGGEVRFLPSIRADSVEELLTPEWRRDPSRLGGTALVLGAGNVSSIAPMDALTKIVVERKAVLLKTHPVLDSLGTLVERTFSPFVEAGLLRVISGDARIGAYLCRHECVDEIHITGSDKTHDAIVFGTGEQGARRRARKRPLLDKPITSELGNVSPVIVVPGRWSNADIDFHAANVASMLVNNAGFNCNAARLIVLSRDWPQKDSFLKSLGRVLARLPLRGAWYPGSIAKHRRFMASHPEAQRFGDADEGQLPWTLVGPLDAEDEDEICFREEAFCGLFAFVELQGTDAAGFLRRAIPFVNQRVWGTLNACLIIDPRTQRDHRGEVERALEALRYGTIGVNHWPAVGYALATAPWGAYPGHTLDDIQSGRGFVHNAFLYGGIEKTVIRGPFRLWPHPAWFVTRRGTLKLAKLLTAFESNPSAFKIPGILWHAMRG